jgi:hypothetical protein
MPEIGSLLRICAIRKLTHGKECDMKHNIQHGIVVFLTCLTALLLGVIGGNSAANEVFKWTDENGVVHFGDRPPEGQKTQIIDIPQASSSNNAWATPSPDDAQPGSDSSAADATKLPGEEEEAPMSLADQRREQIATDRKERREEREETERMCAKHRQRLTQMEPARRVFYTDETGQSVRMDDDVRMDLIAEDKAFIAENCK